MTRYDLSAGQWIIVFVFISAVAVVLFFAIFIRSILRWKVIRGLRDGIFYSNRYYMNELPKVFFWKYYTMVSIFIIHVK
jgi:hypothetical protein